MARKLSRAEQETVITRCADEDEWLVYTCDPAVKKRLIKLTTVLGISLSIVDEWGVQGQVAHVVCQIHDAGLGFCTRTRESGGTWEAARSRKQGEAGRE